MFGVRRRIKLNADDLKRLCKGETVEKRKVQITLNGLDPLMMHQAIIKAQEEQLAEGKT